MGGEKGQQSVSLQMVCFRAFFKLSQSAISLWCLYEELSNLSSNEVNDVLQLNGCIYHLGN